MSHHDGLRPADATILRHLSAESLDYPLCIASAGNLEPTLVRKRCASLAERDLIEPVSPETVYRLTEAGERRLTTVEEAMREAESVTPAGGD